MTEKTVRMLSYLDMEYGREKDNQGRRLNSSSSKIMSGWNTRVKPQPYNPYSRKDSLSGINWIAMRR
jgi:hypothetical protein